MLKNDTPSAFSLDRLYEKLKTIESIKKMNTSFHDDFRYSFHFSIADSQKSV